MPGQLPGQVALLLRRHLVELVAEVLEVVAAPSPGRRRGSRPACRSRRATAPGSARSATRPLLVGRVDLGADVGLDRAEPGEVRVEVVRVLAQLAGEVAQLLGEPRPRIVRRPGPSTRAPRRCRRSGRPVRSAASRTCCCWAMTASCGFGSSRTAARAAATATSAAARRPAREPRPEQAGWRGPERRAARRAAGGGRTDRPRRPRRRRSSALGVVGGRPARGPAEAGNADRELEGARDAVAERALGVDRQRRLAEPRPGADAGRRASRARPTTGIATRRDRQPISSGTNRATVQQRQLGDERPRPGDPRPPDEPAEPQPPAVREERRPGRRRGAGIERRPAATAAGRAGPRRRRGPAGAGAGATGEPRSDAASGAPRRRRADGAGASAGSARRTGRTARTKTTDRTSQAATLFGQNASRATPNGSTSRRDRRRRPACRWRRPASAAAPTSSGDRPRRVDAPSGRRDAAGRRATGRMPDRWSRRSDEDHAVLVGQELRFE